MTFTMGNTRRPDIDLSDESNSERLVRKAKNAPVVPIGIAGCLGAVLYATYGFKQRGEMSTSVYLMKFRVVAQSFVVCTLGAGIAYSMFSEYVLPKLQQKKLI